MVGVPRVVLPEHLRENWQSEWLQLVFQAVLIIGAKHLLFRVDAEDMERLEAKVDQINQRLRRGPLRCDRGPPIASLAPGVTNGHERTREG